MCLPYFCFQGPRNTLIWLPLFSHIILKLIKPTFELKLDLSPSLIIWSSQHLYVKMKSKELFWSCISVLGFKNCFQITMEDDFWEKSNHELNRYSPQQTIVPPYISPNSFLKRALYLSCGRYRGRPKLNCEKFLLATSLCSLCKIIITNFTFFPEGKILLLLLTPVTNGFELLAKLVK